MANNVMYCNLVGLKVPGDFRQLSFCGCVGFAVHHSCSFNHALVLQKCAILLETRFFIGGMTLFLRTVQQEKRLK